MKRKRIEDSYIGKWKLKAIYVDEMAVKGGEEMAIDALSNMIGKNYRKIDQCKG